MDQNDADDTEPPYSPESQLDPETARVVYAELGHQVEKMDAVLAEFEQQDLDHTEEYEQLEARRGRFCSMRGHLQAQTDEELNANRVDSDEMIQLRPEDT